MLVGVPWRRRRQVDGMLSGWWSRDVLSLTVHDGLYPPSAFSRWASTRLPLKNESLGILSPVSPHHTSIMVSGSEPCRRHGRYRRLRSNRRRPGCYRTPGLESRVEEMPYCARPGYDQLYEGWRSVLLKKGLSSANLKVRNGRGRSPSNRELGTSHSDRSAFQPQAPCVGDFIPKEWTHTQTLSKTYQSQNARKDRYCLGNKGPEKSFDASRSGRLGWSRVTRS